MILNLMNFKEKELWKFALLISWIQVIFAEVKFSGSKNVIDSDTNYKPSINDWSESVRIIRLRQLSELENDTILINTEEYDEIIIDDLNLALKDAEKWYQFNKKDFYFVRRPKLFCTNDTECDGVGGQCNEEGECDCLDDDLCWVYDYDASGFIPTYTFQCGYCGQLGSTCIKNNCDPPGKCFSDGYCHCQYGGEHKGPDICVLMDVNKILILFLGGFVVFALLGLAVILYSFFVSYRRNGTIWWCLVIRRRRRPVPIRVNPENGLVKTPAFTVERMYENFSFSTDLAQPSTSTNRISSSTRRDSDLDSVTHANQLYMKDWGQAPTSNLSMRDIRTNDNQRKVRRKRRIPDNTLEPQPSVSRLQENSSVNEIQTTSL